jgi:hypothetical protein
VTPGAEYFSTPAKDLGGKEILSVLGIRLPSLSSAKFGKERGIGKFKTSPAKPNGHNYCHRGRVFVRTPLCSAKKTRSIL